MSTNNETFKIYQQDDVLSIADAASNVVIKPEEEYAYGFIIEVLTSGLYPDVFHVIREYVQNSFDAIIAWRRVIGDSQTGNVQITIDPPSIFIFDDGTGMGRKKVREYRYVGYSSKSMGTSVGFRGIGKLSGISVAEKLILTTTPYGVAERYKLVFDAKTMLEHILELKHQGQNIPLNDLIRKYTILDTEKEDEDQHYTLIELHNVRQKSQVLLDQKELSNYLALNVPVDFDTNFKYKDTVDEWLRTYVRDYDTVPLTVNGTQIYKYCLPNAKPPQREFIWSDEDKTGLAPNRYIPFDGGDSEEDANAPKLLAFCWYCEHEERGQFDNRQHRGLVYRVRNFAVGDNQLPRITLWKASPERAYYFFGEIHVCDSEVVPSSERGNFEENSARARLYRCGSNTLSHTLNQIAGASSDERRAKEFIEAAENLISTIEAELVTGIPKETRLLKLVALQNARNRVKDRISKAPLVYQQRGVQVVEKAGELVQKLDTLKPKQEDGRGFYDIKDELGMSSESARMYDIIMDVLKDEFGGQPDVYERLLKRIHSTLEERWDR